MRGGGRTGPWGEGALHHISLRNRETTHPYYPPYYVTFVVREARRPPLA